MKSTSSKALGLSLAAALAVPTTAFATNGYFLIGYGAKSRSMGGVGVAFAQDGLAAATNPAGMADVDVDTMRIDAGGEFFLPKRAFRHDSQLLESNFPGSDGGVNHRSGSNVFLIPSMGGIYKFNRKVTLGMAVIGNGANTRYDQTVPGNPECSDFFKKTDEEKAGVPQSSTAFNFNCLGSTTLGVQLLQMQMLPSVAYKLNKNHTVGASIAIGVQQFRAYGLQSFGELGFSNTGGDAERGLTNQGNDYSYGAGVRFGYLGKFFKKRLSLGANYSSRIYMTEFDDYDALFAEQGDFDIPENYTVGLAYKLTDDLTVTADYQRINYSDVKSIGNVGPNAADPDNLIPPGFDKTGADNGLGFGWDDANVYKIGLNYDYNKNWSFRAGYNYAETPIKDDQVMFNFLAPAVTEHHATIGASYRPNRNMEWSFNYMHAFSNTIKGPTPFPPEGTTGGVNGENGSIDMHINSIGVSFGYSM
jgi:long-chain fatty acid transport protein